MKAVIKISLSILSGVLLSAAWPQRGFTPLIFIALTPLLMIEHYADKGQRSDIFGLSFLSFLTWNILTTWWVWNSTPAAAAAFLLNALFMAFTFWLYHTTRRRLFGHDKGYFLLPFFWLSFELLHYHWSAKWPWLNMGNVFSTHPSWIQWYEYTGTLGGSLWIIVVNIFIFKTILSLFNLSGTRRQGLYHLGATLLIVFIPIVVSRVIYDRYEEKGRKVEVVVVQQNCDPWSEQYELSTKDIVSRNTTLSSSVITDSTLFVISSESALQEGLWLHNANTDSESVHLLRQFINEHPQVNFIVGATSYELVPPGEEDDFAARKFSYAERYYYAHNSALLLDTATMQYRHKTKLVPGVEAIPSWMTFLKNQSITMEIARGTLKGDDEIRIFDAASYHPAVMICYESAFGGYMASFARGGADLFFVITNDGWWGNTPGHRQHFELSKLRAIECRRHIARSANTGISGFIDQRGEVISHTNYWEPDALRHTLLANNELTFYAQHGDYLGVISAVIAILAVVSTIIMNINSRIVKRRKS